MAGVFLSYARFDSGLGERIVAGLRALDVECWWDRDMPGHPTYSGHLQPTIYSVESIRSDGKLDEFDFYSLATAHRIGRLIQEASRRCGADPLTRE